MAGEEVHPMSTFTVHALVMLNYLTCMLWPVYDDTKQNATRILDSKGTRFENHELKLVSENACFLRVKL